MAGVTDGVVLQFRQKPENLIELEWVLEVLDRIPQAFLDGFERWLGDRNFDLTTDAGVAVLLDYAHHCVSNVRSECDRVYRELDEWRSERRRCVGVTRRGTRCRYLAPEGQALCGEHARMAAEGRLEVVEEPGEVGDE